MEDNSAQTATTPDPQSITNQTPQVNGTPQPVPQAAQDTAGTGSVPPTPGPVSTPQTSPQEPKQDLKEIEKNLESTITEKVSKGVIDKIASALGLNKEEKEEIPTDPKELKKYIEDTGRKSAESLISERERVESEAKEAEQRKMDEGSKYYTDLFTRQYNELAEAGKVPKIEKEGDKNDLGNKARAAILTKMYEVINANKQAGVDYVPTLKEIFYENPDIVSTVTTAGANTPVSGNGRAHASTAGGMNHADLRASSFEQVASQSGE